MTTNTWTCHGGSSQHSVEQLRGGAGTAACKTPGARRRGREPA
ncbi:hypothetical protein QJS66_04700 [Kocuria rhizophila]|nr:hypothetical protein QJS66_04700 [Kocuria rhizophila]